MKNKQNGVSQDGWKGEQNNTAQRLYSSGSQTVVRIPVVVREGL